VIVLDKIVCKEYFSAVDYPDLMEAASISSITVIAHKRNSMYTATRTKRVSAGVKLKK
jgi:hypothetical protein